MTVLDPPPISEWGKDNEGLQRFSKYDPSHELMLMAALAAEALVAENFGDLLDQVQANLRQSKIVATHHDIFDAAWDQYAHLYFPAATNG